MDTKAFGKFLKGLRKEKDNYYRRWRQEDLAQRAGLSTRQVARIEEGQVKDLWPYVGTLASAFRLNEIQMAEFYAQAGYHYRPKIVQENRQAVSGLLRQIELPASAKTPMWDFVAFNEYHRIMWGYTKANIKKLDEGVVGPNLLRVFFDEEFYEHQAQHENRDENLRRTVLMFRTDAFPYLSTKRYRTIVSGMMEYPLFEDIWHDLENLRIENSNLALFTKPATHIIHPQYGDVAKIGLVLPRRFTGYGIDISVHVPIVTPETESGYERLQQALSEVINQVYEFREEKLE